MKIILLIIVFSCSLIIGILISKYFKRRQEFYLDLCSYFEITKLSISYSQSKLIEIISKNKAGFHTDFYLFLSHFEQFLLKNIETSEFKAYDKLNFLDREEREEIFNFFSSLGEMAKEEEIERLEINNKKFSDKKDKSIFEYKKFSSLYLKLFIILGITFVIIFI